MAYPFVQSAVDLGSARGPRLAIAWHMAEGWSTVEYLRKPNPNGVSVHFVVERSGRIVQMLGLDRMHTSIRIRNVNGSLALRSTTDDPAVWGVAFGARSRRAVMGEWADIATTLGPNHASVGVEVEGFAAEGPNVLQAGAMVGLWRDLSARYPGIRSLGHRDFNVKTCPGRLIPWAALGGHGPLEDTDVKIEHKIERWTLDGGPGKVTTYGAPYKADGTVNYQQRLAYLSDRGGANDRLELIGRVRLSDPDDSQDQALRSALVTYALPSGDCTAEVAAATAPLEARISDLIAARDESERVRQRLNDERRSAVTTLGGTPGPNV